MKKTKNLVIFFIIILLILSMSNVVKAVTNYTTIIRGNNNQWIQFPDKLTRSWITNWDGYYTYDGTLNKISTSEDVKFEIQSCCILEEYVDEIQNQSDQTPDDDEFTEWLNNYAINLIDEEKWTSLTNMKISVECTLGKDVEHEHLVFIKVIENDTESIVWQGYGDGFSRISNSRKNLTLESIEITTPPTKTNYTEGELFDSTGMVITAKYSDGSSKIVTDYTYEPKTALKTTDASITIEYTENDITKEATQEIKVAKKDNITNSNTTSNNINGVDTTTATKELPQTGKEIGIIFALIAAIVIGVAIYLKYRKMKDIFKI